MVAAVASHDMRRISAEKTVMDANPCAKTERWLASHRRRLYDFLQTIIVNGNVINTRTLSLCDCHRLRLRLQILYACIVVVVVVGSVPP